MAQHLELLAYYFGYRCCTVWLLFSKQTLLLLKNAKLQLNQFNIDNFICIEDIIIETNHCVFVCYCIDYLMFACYSTS